MIRVIYAPQLQGDFWLDYGGDDEWSVTHFLCGNHWNPHPAKVKRFLAIASMHGVHIEYPKELHYNPKDPI